MGNFMPAKKKKNKNRESDRSREFVLLLYPENELHSLAYLKLTSYQYSALGVLHDKDTYTKDIIDEETGELLHHEGDYKKEHYHFYIKFSNPRYISGIADELNIESHLIDFCDAGFKNYAEYMLHWGKHGGPGKYTYDTSDFVGVLKSSAIQKLSNEPPELKLHKIYLFIYNCANYVEYSDVYKWSFDNGYSGICTSRLNVIMQWIYDHNKRFYDDSR